MKIIKTIAEMREVLSSYKKSGKTIGLVPDDLRRRFASTPLPAKDCDVTVVSVFVNRSSSARMKTWTVPPPSARRTRNSPRSTAPLLFSPPKSRKCTLTEIRSRSCAMNPLNPCTAAPTAPGISRGVLTVVTKLFMITGANKAYFGPEEFSAGVPHPPHGRGSELRHLKS